MKKYILLTLSLLFASVALQARNGDNDVRIYLNAGHGSWGPNDRPMATIPYPANPETGRPDTLGFYETNTNLWKILKLGKTLEKMGVKKENILYSRTLNGPYPYVKGAPDEEKYNRNLSEICAEVEANNMDMFISIHSNAAADGSLTNYPLFLYRGQDGKGNDWSPGSYDMCKACWEPHFVNDIDIYSYYSKTQMNIRGDSTFYGGAWVSDVTGKKGYLGVLRHGVPGFLLEGYFHTYQPARHRALNPDYCGQEGIRVARGVCDYFNLTPEKTGYIMGTVKDMHEKIVHQLFNYAPNTNDQWLPLNGAEVTLLKDGNQVGTYKVDNNYNGVFVFEGLAPGDYTFSVKADGYKELTEEYKKAIKVEANQTSYAKLLLESESYVPPAIVYENYPEPNLPSYVGVPGKIEFSNSSKAFEDITGKIQRAIVRGDSTIILSDNNGEPVISLINNKTNEFVKKLSINGIAAAEPDNDGFKSRLSDIAFTADGKLVGVNSEECQFNDGQVREGSTRGEIFVYKWDDFDSDPAVWVSTKSSANYYNAIVGRTLAVSGPSNDCHVFMSAANYWGDKHIKRFIDLNIVDNQIASTVFTEKDIKSTAPSPINKLATGLEVLLQVSPLADDQYVIDGTEFLPVEFKPAKTVNVNSEVLGQLSDQDNLVGQAATGVSFFKYAHHSMMVTPFVKDGKVGGLRLYDITEGIDKAKLIQTNTDLPEALPATTDMGTGASVDGKDINLYLIVGNVITTFTTKGIEQPAVKRIMAYDLKGEQLPDNSYKFTFTSNDDAQSAQLVFTDAATGEEVGTADIPDVKQGNNTITLTADQLPGQSGQKLNWAVRLTGSAVANISRLTSNDASMQYPKTVFVAVDNSPESDYFGRFYVNAYSIGMYAYNPDWTRINENPYIGKEAKWGSQYRLGVDSKGTVYISDWSDDHSGVYLMNPADLEGEYTQFFVGERNSKGLFVNNGVNVGSSSPGLCVYGTGADTKLFVSLEDFGKDVGVYNIGNEDGTIASTWDKAPSQIFKIGNYEINGNCNLVGGLDGGVWVAQYRGAGNNVKGVPSLIYVNHNGEIVFNSGTQEFAPLLNGSAKAGFAVNKENSLLVINDGTNVLQFFDITWNEGVPTLTPKYSYKASLTGTGIQQMAFDYAGNLVIGHQGVSIFSIPTEENVTTVPAKKSLVINATTGINEVAVAPQLRISPNPTTGRIHIETSEAIKSVRVYSVSGSLVAEGFNADMDLSRLPNGIYIVKVNNFNGVRIIKR